MWDSTGPWSYCCWVWHRQWCWLLDCEKLMGCKLGRGRLYQDGAQFGWQSNWKMWNSNGGLLPYQERSKSSQPRPISTVSNSAPNCLWQLLLLSWEQYLLLSLWVWKIMLCMGMLSTWVCHLLRWLLFLLPTWLSRLQSWWRHLLDGKSNLTLLHFTSRENFKYSFLGVVS